MSVPPLRGDRDRAAAGIAQLEGYLLAQAERRAARVAAEEFADRLTWLAPEQREEVVRLYTTDRMALARITLQRLADRSREMRAEYTERYEQLRRRLVCTTCLALALLAASAFVAVTVRVAG